MGRSLLFAAILSLASASAARAVDCAQWSRLDDTGKAAVLDRMIQGRLSSGEFEDYTSVRRAAVRNCLARASSNIGADFDSTCSQGLEAGMEALNRVFEGYVASCIP
jgi:hypothetical protein